MEKDNRKIIALGKGSSGGGGDAVWGSIGGTISNQTDLMTELNKKANTSSLSTVATSGDYNDLSNKPTIPTKTSDLNNDSGFITLSDVPAQVQSDWNESDTNSPAYIVGKPTIPSSSSFVDLTSAQTISGVKTFSAIPTFDTTTDDGRFVVKLENATIGTNPSANQIVGFRSMDSQGREFANINCTYITSGRVGCNLYVNDQNGHTGRIGVFVDKNGTGAYTETVTPPTVDNSTKIATTAWVNAQNYVVGTSLATVATTGSYSDLTNKPTIPAAQVQSDWNQSNNQSVDYIKNKPSMSTDILTFVDANNVSTTVVVYTQPQI